MAETIEVMVTGASGYIGAHVVNECLEEGYIVRAGVRNVNDPRKCDPLKKLAENTKGQLILVECDVLKPETCKSAISGCTHVLHLAAIVDLGKNDNKEASDVNIEGSRNVLEACKESGTVKRVVFTSTVASLGVLPLMRPFNEDDWNPMEPGTPNSFVYAKSKTLAEKFVWDFAAKLPDEQKFEVVSILPSIVVGPPLTDHTTFSLDHAKRFMSSDPMIPKIAFPVVDVIDVARAHVISLTLPGAAGQRFIISDKTSTYYEIRVSLNEEFNQHGYYLSTRFLPFWLFRLLVYFGIEKNVDLFLHTWDTIPKYDSSKMLSVLGIKSRCSTKALIDMIYKLIDMGYIEKSKDYKGRSASQIE